MANMKEHGMRLARLYREDYYDILDRKLNKVSKEVTPTLASAVYEMKLRGFSSRAIEEDLECLGFDKAIDPYTTFHEPVHPMSQYYLCVNHP